MSEYIEREALKNNIAKSIEPFNTGSVFRAINAIPAADVAQVVHGQWVHSRYEDCSEQFELVKCSQCSHEAYAIAFYVRNGNYCPNCGAKMDGSKICETI